MKRVLGSLIVVLIAVGLLASTWSKWNGVTVGSTAGNVSKYNSVSIGTTAGNIGAWNTLASPSSGGGSATVTLLAVKQGSFASPYTSPALSASVPSGSVVKGFCVTNQANSGTSYTVTFTDSKSNTWTTNLVYTNTTFTSAVITATSFITNALTTSDTFTVTPAHDGAFNCAWVSITGLSLATEENATGNLTNATATGSTASITPGAATSVVFAVFDISGTFSAYGNCMGSAATGVLNSTQTSGHTIVVEWRQLAIATAGNCTMTMTAANDATSVIDDLR